MTIMENRLAYKLRVVRNMSLGLMKEFVDEIHERTGKNRLSIALDMVHCARRFGSGYHDYITYHFYELTDPYRATYMTRMKSKKLMEYMNDRDAASIFDDKSRFDEVFREFVARDFLDAKNCTREEAARFYRDNKKGFGKKDLTCGTDAEILTMEDFADSDAFYDYIKKKEFTVVEEYFVNHEKIREVYPLSLNTMRMITVIDDEGKPQLFFAAQKFGRDGRFVDVRGLHAPIDLETGTIKFPFHSGDTTTDDFYTEHPNTGYPLIGFEVPLFEEAKEMILRAAALIPKMRYVGWDVAVTDRGPVIVEGNDYTAYDYMQLPGQQEGKEGILPDLFRLVPSLKNVL